MTINNDKKRIFGTLVDSRMREKGIKSKHLAEKLNVTPQAVNKWRRGDAIPGPEILPKLAAELSLSVDELLTGEQQPIENKAEGRLRAMIDSLGGRTAAVMCMMIGVVMLTGALFGLCSVGMLFGNYVFESFSYFAWGIMVAFWSLGGVYLLISGYKTLVKHDKFYCARQRG